MSLETEFFSYHADNPQIYQYVDRLAQQAIRAGYRKFAIATIWEKIRWEILINTRSNANADFKLPNNHRAYYARMWMRNNPKYGDFFQTCRLRSQEPGEVDRFGRDLDDDDFRDDLFDE